MLDIVDAHRSRRGERVDARERTRRDVQLRAARRDPILMGDQMRRAWLDWLGAELEARPVVVVLEDLHWGDPATVDTLNTVLLRQAKPG